MWYFKFERILTNYYVSYKVTNVITSATVFWDTVDTVS